MKGLEFIFLGVGSVLGAFLRYKLTESPLLFNTLPVNVLMVNIAGKYYWCFYSWNICCTFTTSLSRS
jgi:fluoride ion exporter CrcB/FEX